MLKFRTMRDGCVDGPLREMNLAELRVVRIRVRGTASSSSRTTPRTAVGRSAQV